MTNEKQEYTEPVYYNENGLSPIKAFKEGLISQTEYIGFCKGNIIKYTVRCDKKNNNPSKDIKKAKHYLTLLDEVLSKEL